MSFEKLSLCTSDITIAGKSATSPTPTICLTMIIKNESRIILRCLSAALSVCDYMCICDTGSTDNTCEIVTQFFADNADATQGTLHHHEWKNFGHNRSLSIDAAKNSGATYMLCIDADMILEVLPEFNKASLTADSYLMVQRTFSLYYYNTRIMRTSLDWRCVGVTHEFYACGEGVQYSEEKLTTLLINDVGDGGSKADKFERDIRLLTQGLVDEPENERYMFYLAESYKNFGKPTEAILWYRRRIEKEGFAEETWVAHCRVGDCYQHLEDWPRALTAYLEAYNYRPTRAEPIHKIVEYYRETGKQQVAMRFCEMGLAIPFPVQDSLFIQHKVYAFELLWELSVLAFYSKQKEAGLMACERLLHDTLPYKDKLGNSGPSDRMLAQVQSNRLYYVPALYEFGTVFYQQIQIPTPEQWAICNPCIIQEQAGGYSLMVRSVNYVLHPHNNTYDYPFGNVDTVTYRLALEAHEVGELSNQMAITRTDTAPSLQAPIKDTDTMTYYDSLVVGFEDVRIVRDGHGQLYGFATSKMTNPDNMCEIVMLPISENTQETQAENIEETTNSNLQIERVVRLRGYQDELHQKNWMPFIHEGEVHIVYSCDPLVILRPDLETGQCAVVSKKTNQRWKMPNYRGSSQGIPFEDGYLFVIHEVSMSGAARKYTHRFIYMTHAFEITRLSQPFYFRELTIEFVSGMCLDVSGEFACMCLGYQDKEAWLAKLSVGEISDMLNYGATLDE